MGIFNASFWRATGLILTLAVPGMGFASADQGRVYVAPMFVSAPEDARLAVPAGKVEVRLLGDLREGSKVLVEAASDNKAFPDITVLAMDQDSIPAYLAGQHVEAVGFVRRAPPLRFTLTAPRAGRYVLVFDNRYSMLMTKQVRVRTTVAQQMSGYEVDQITGGINQLLRQVHTRYDVPAFGVRVQPCGMVNAFSKAKDGEITLCTEMIAKTVRSPGALIGITYHELGHSLLALWGLPGHDNEDTADEFAVQLALRSQRDAQVLDQFAAFFDTGDAWMEARAVIERGDRHTIGVQRARNIRQAIRNAKEVTARWNALTYQRMTSDALAGIVNNPQPLESADLARKVLAERRAATPTANAPAAAGETKVAKGDAPAYSPEASLLFAGYTVPVLGEAEIAKPRDGGEKPVVNYAGRYAVQVQSCGTGCRVYSMRDLVDGRALPWLDRFAAAEPRPLTREGYPYLSILYTRPDSTLLVAQFEVDLPSGGVECRQQLFNVSSIGLKTVSPVKKGCTEMIRPH